MSDSREIHLPTRDSKKGRAQILCAVLRIGGQPSPKVGVTTHMVLAFLAAGRPGRCQSFRDGRITRQLSVADRVTGTMIVELKNVSTALGPRDRAAIDDQLSLVGHTVTVGGTPYNIDNVKVPILDPEGVLANASYMHERLLPITVLFSPTVLL